MEGVFEEVVWNSLSALLAIALTCTVCSYVVMRQALRSYNPTQCDQHFNQEQKRQLRKLLAKTSDPSDEDVARLLLHRSFVQRHVTKRQVVKWIKRIKLDVRQLIKEASGRGQLAALGGETTSTIADQAGEITGAITSSALRDRPITAPRGEITSQITALTGEITTTTALRERQITALRWEITCQITALRGEITSTAALRGGEIARRWRDY